MKQIEEDKVKTFVAQFTKGLRVDYGLQNIGIYGNKDQISYVYNELTDLKNYKNSEIEIKKVKQENDLLLILLLWNKRVYSIGLVIQ